MLCTKLAAFLIPQNGCVGAEWSRIGWLVSSACYLAYRNSLAAGI